MDKAICWEMLTPAGSGGAAPEGVLGMRVCVAANFVGIQTLVSSNERPVWAVDAYPSQADATQVAVALTRAFEEDYRGRLSVEPGEVILHDAERASMSNGGTIPPSLRARIFTSLHRRRQGFSGTPNTTT